jgi:23S rRNA (cytidine1920-2'-O)/16S rRNA (cytidine1409-2'-O)-methyltransferase
VCAEAQTGVVWPSAQIQRLRVWLDTLPRMSKSRLDALLAERGLFESRSRAAAAVMAGKVRIGGEGARASKPGQMVASDVRVSVDPGQEYVSRGGVKLANALDTLGVDVAGRECLDVGASTGGFTDCLLQRGAAHVVALDVAYGELHWRLRGDPRVTVVERANARALSMDALPYRPGLIVVDVSFISLGKVLPAVLPAGAPDGPFDCLALVKPQFELGRERVGKGGVVRSAADRREALVSVGEDVVGLGYSVLGFASSGLPGPAGNRESFVWIGRVGDTRAVGDVAAAADLVEGGGGDA